MRLRCRLMHNRAVNRCWDSVEASLSFGTQAWSVGDYLTGDRKMHSLLHYTEILASGHSRDAIVTCTYHAINSGSCSRVWHSLRDRDGLPPTAIYGCICCKSLRVANVIEHASVRCFPSRVPQKGHSHGSVEFKRVLRRTSTVACCVFLERTRIFRLGHQSISNDSS